MVFGSGKTGALITRELGKPGPLARAMQSQWRMKTKKSLGKVIGFVMAGAFLVPLVGQTFAQESASMAESSVVSGRVTATSGDSLVVDGNAITVSGSTAIIKDGAAIKLNEVKAGDEVRVTVAKSAEGALQALSIEVLKAEN